MSIFPHGRGKQKVITEDFNMKMKTVFLVSFSPSNKKFDFINFRVLEKQLKIDAERECLMLTFSYVCLYLQ